MPQYKYEAIDEEGNLIRGTMEVNDESELEMRLQHTNKELLSCKKLQSFNIYFGNKKVDKRDLISFCFQLEQQIRAGIPLIEGLEDIRDSTDNRKLKEITNSIVEKINEGTKFSKALADYPNVFDPVFVSLVDAGERSGKLVEIISTLSDTLKWQDEITAQAKRAATYPAFVAISVLAVVVAMMVFLVPEMIKFITSIGNELPIHTKVLIAVSDAIRDHGFKMLLAIVTFVFVFIFTIKTSEKAKWMLDMFKLKAPLIGEINTKITLSRFTNNFALLYSSGITVMECLEISQGIVANKVLAKALNDAGQKISEGESISKSFEATNLFPKLIVRMLAIGESTGELDSSLKNISYFYNRDINELMQKLQDMIGPTMTVILGIILGWVILSVIGPIYDTLTSVTI